MWDNDDFDIAFAFSAIVVFWLVFWFCFYIKWIAAFYGQLEPIIDEFLAVFYREPQKLAAFNMLVCNILIMSVRLFGSFGNVFYYTYYNDAFGKGCDPWNFGEL